MEESQISSVMATVNETHDQVMKLNVTVNSIIARLEAFEKMYANNISSKRTIKVAATSQDDDEASVSSAGSKRKQTVNATVISCSEEKIINALTFFKKYIMFKNYENLRDKYSTPESINVAKAGVKKPENSEAYWISIGNALWKVLDKDQKKDVREEFAKWKKLHQISGDATQLNEDEIDGDE